MHRKLQSSKNSVLQAWSPNKLLSNPKCVQNSHVAVIVRVLMPKDSQQLFASVAVFLRDLVLQRKQNRYWQVFLCFRSLHMTPALLKHCQALLVYCLAACIPQAWNSRISLFSSWLTSRSWRLKALIFELWRAAAKCIGAMSSRVQFPILLGYG